MPKKDPHIKVPKDRHVLQRVADTPLPGEKFSPQRLGEISRMVAAGYSQNDIAYLLGTNRKNITYWKKRFPELAVAFRDGKKHAIKKLVAKAFMVASGYRYTTTKTVINKDADGTVKSVREEKTEHYEKPDNYVLIWLVTNMVRQLGLDETEAWLSRNRMEIDQKILNMTVTPDQVADQIAQMAGSIKRPEIAEPKTKKIKSKTV